MRELGIQAVRLLNAVLDRVAGCQHRREVAVQKRAACDRAADGQRRPRAHDGASRDLPAIVVVRDPRVGERPVGHRARPFDDAVDAVHLDAGVEPHAVDERQAAVGCGIAQRIAREPSAAAHADEIVGGRRQRVRPQRGEVLIGERRADQEVARAVRALAEGAERRRDAADLNIEAARRPWADAREQGERLEPIAVIHAQLAEQLEARCRPQLGGDPEPDVAQRAVFVVGVVEEAGIGRRERDGGIPREHDPSVAEGDRLGRHLSPRDRGAQQHGKREHHQDSSHDTSSRKYNAPLPAVRFHLVLGAVALAAALLAAAAADTQSRTVALPPARGLSVDVTIGSVRVEGSSRTDALIEIVRHAPDDGALSRLPVEIVEEENDVRVRVLQPEGGTDPALRSDVTLRVPQAALLRSIRIVEGKLTLQALSGSITADVRRGQIDAVDLAGTVRLETGIGSVTANRMRLSPDGLLRLRAFNGNVILSLAARPADARILALALNGTIASDIPLTRKDTWGPRWSEATLGKGEPVISLDVVTGGSRSRPRDARDLMI